MPAHQRPELDNCDGFEDRRKPWIQQDEEQAIAVRELDATADLASQRDQLVSERGILRFKSARRLERRGQQPEKEAQQRNHCRVTLRDSATRSIRTMFSAHTGVKSLTAASSGIGVGIRVRMRS